MKTKSHTTPFTTVIPLYYIVVLFHAYLLFQLRLCFQQKHPYFVVQQYQISVFPSKFLA